MTVYQTKEYFDAFGIDYKILDINAEISIPYILDDDTCYCYTTLLNLSADVQEQIKEKVFSATNAKKIILEGCIVEGTVSMSVDKITSDDNVTYLPNSLEEFTNSLGKKTRQHLKYYQRLIDRDGVNISKIYSDCNNSHSNALIMYSGGAEKLFSEIYRLNSERCLSKGFESGANQKWLPVVKKLGRMIAYEYMER